MDLFGDVARQYADFAAYAREDSPCLADWATAAAADPDVMAWVSQLPPLKQQPNLVFAAARWHGVPAPGPYAALRAALLGDDGDIARTVLTRSTQTNEVGRLATLMPVLAGIARESARPLALLEVGASAGLCLYPERYDYAWPPVGGLTGSGGPLLTCEVTGRPDLPAAVPQVAWRGGIDLHPLDVTDADAMAWLAVLVWPEQDERRARLAAAIEVARSDPPVLVRGNLLTELPAAVETAARHGQVVVFHSAVIAYLEPADRARFVEMMTGLVAGGTRWVSNEAKNVLPQVTATGPDVPADLPTFVLGVDGHAVAWTHGHGRTMTWLPE
jgi:hypothetical protein